MRPGHSLQGDGFAIFAQAGSVASIVAEAILDADDDPVEFVSGVSSCTLLQIRENKKKTCGMR